MEGHMGGVQEGTGAHSGEKELGATMAHHRDALVGISTAMGFAHHVAIP